MFCDTQLRKYIATRRPLSSKTKHRTKTLIPPRRGGKMRTKSRREKRCPRDSVAGSTVEIVLSMMDYAQPRWPTPCSISCRFSAGLLRWRPHPLSPRDRNGPTPARNKTMLCSRSPGSLGLTESAEAFEDLLSPTCARALPLRLLCGGHQLRPNQDELLRSSNSNEALVLPNLNSGQTGAQVTGPSSTLPLAPVVDRGRSSRPPHHSSAACHPISCGCGSPLHKRRDNDGLRATQPGALPAHPIPRLELLVDWS